MAIVVDASGEGLTRTTSLPSATAFTITGWAYTTERAGVNSYVCSFLDTGNTHFMLLGYSSSSSTQLRLDCNSGQPLFNGGGYTTHGAWFFWALRRDTDNIFVGRAFRPGTDSTFGTAQTTESTFGTLIAIYLGTDDINDWSNCRVANVKLWDAVLTDAELYNEMWSVVPKRRTNMHLWSPLFNGLTDYSGAGKTWTSLGTATWADGAPVGWGSSRFDMQLQAGTATPLWLPGYYL